MSKFTFDKKEPVLLTLEIDGKEYHFNPHTLGVKVASERFVKCQQPLVNTIKNKKVTQKELESLVIKSCTLVKETVNSIIGKGTYEKIFAGRTVDFVEHQKLMSYLFEEIAAFSKVNMDTTDKSNELIAQ